MSKQKLVFITNIPNQYRIPLFNELHAQLEDKGVELYVIFGAAGYNKRMSILDLSDCNFRYKILRSKFFNEIEKRTSFIFYSGLIREIRALNPSEVIVTGYALSTIKLLIYNKFRANGFYIFSGSVQPKGNKTSFLRKIQRRFLIKKAKGFVAYSSFAKKYIVDLGGNPTNITIMGNTVDTIFFKNETNKIRKELPKSTINHLVYIGYINPRKNVEELVYVVQELLKYRSDFVIDIIGDGESQEALKQLICKYKYEKYFNLHGFKQKEELPYFLANSQCFLFQTNFDIWGLVLNEAMAAGLACLASINAGSTEDLIEEGVTGFRVDYSDHKYVAHKIDWLLSNPIEREKIGIQASNFISSNFELSNAASNVIKAIGL